MLEEGRLEADAEVGLLPVTVLLRREGDTPSLNLCPTSEDRALSSRVRSVPADLVPEGGCRPCCPACPCQPLLTASFSGLQTFTHRIWSRSQSMGLSR